MERIKSGQLLLAFPVLMLCVYLCNTQSYSSCAGIAQCLNSTFLVVNDTITCGLSSCGRSTINCTEGYCTIICGQDASCRYANFNCNPGAYCNFECTGPNSCANSVFNCASPSNCNRTCNSQENGCLGSSPIQYASSTPTMTNSAAPSSSASSTSILATNLILSCDPPLPLGSSCVNGTLYIHSSLTSNSINSIDILVPVIVKDQIQLSNTHVTFEVNTSAVPSILGTSSVLVEDVTVTINLRSLPVGEIWTLLTGEEEVNMSFAGITINRLNSDQSSQCFGSRAQVNSRSLNLLITPGNCDDGRKETNTKLIGGIVGGVGGFFVIVVIVLVAVGIVAFIQKRKRKKMMHEVMANAFSHS